MKTKISKSGEFSKHFPNPVADRIREIASDYQSGIKSVSIKDVDENKKFYVGEGDRFIGMKSDGTGAEFEVVSANNIGASNLSHSIGQTFTMPSGTYLIRIYYYSRYWMEVYKIAIPQLTD